MANCTLPTSFPEDGLQSSHSAIRLIGIDPHYFLESIHPIFEPAKLVASTTFHSYEREREKKHGQELIVEPIMNCLSEGSIQPKAEEQIQPSFQNVGIYPLFSRRTLRSSLKF